VKTMNFSIALRKAIGVVRDGKRAAYLQSASSRYRLIPDAQHSRGYTIHLSIRYDREWQPWGEVDHFAAREPTHRHRKHFAWLFGWPVRLARALEMPIERRS